MKIAKLSHVIYKLDEHFTKDGFYGQFGEGSTFPQVVLNGDNLGGCTDTVEAIEDDRKYSFCSGHQHENMGNL